MIAVLGPTGSGKSDLAVRIALGRGGEVVTVDSMQVYRGMDIGTAKPSPAVRAAVPHHLVDLVEPGVAFSVAEFQVAGRAVLSTLAERGTPAVIAGGSGLHFRALVDPLHFPPIDTDLREQLEAEDVPALRQRLLEVDPDAGLHVDLDNPRRVLRAIEIHDLTGATPSERARSTAAAAVRSYRPVVPFTAVGVDPGDRLAERITARFDAMLEAGLLDEVADLAPRLGVTAAKAVGYKELLGVVAGEVGLDEGRESAIQATLALAKRQRTFFRRDPRIRWISWQDDADARHAAAEALLVA